MKRQRRRGSAAVLTVALLLAACVGGSGDDPDPDGDAQSESEQAPSDNSADIDQVVEEPPPAVEAIETSLVEPDDERVEPAVEVSFEPVSAADAYLLVLGERDEPIRVEAEDCDSSCTATLDRLTIGSSTAIEVISMAGDARAPASPSTQVPDLDGEAGHLDDFDPDEPMALVVVRSDDATLTVDTEEVDNLSAAEERADELQFEPDVVAVEIDTPGFADQDDEASPPPDGITTWQQHAMDFPLLPSESRGEGVVIAVIDHGVNRQHVTFGNADITTTNILSENDRPAEHGTNVASLILGQPTGRIPGIAPEASVRVYDVFDGSNSFDKSDVVAAIIQAVDDGSDVINLSLSSTCLDLDLVSFGCPDTAMQAGLDYAESHDVVVVAAAGNDGDGADYCDRRLGSANSDRWPANSPTVIAVGGIARDGSVWDCSPDQAYIDVLAPADALLVANASGGYDVGSGTSFAAPLVSGLLAIMLAEHPDLTPAQLREMLSQSVDEDGRMQITMLLGPLDLVEVETFDPVNAQLVEQFQLDVRFPNEGRLEELSGLPDEPGARPPISPHTPDSGVGTMAIRIHGLLSVDENGDVDGFGTLYPFYPRDVRFYGEGLRLSWHAQGFQVSCPRTPINPNQLVPMFEFGWSVSAAVGGRYENGEIELRISLGDGASPDTPGELPPVQIFRDNLGACQKLVEWPNTITSGHVYTTPSPFTYDEVLARRDNLFETAEAMHQEIIDAGPFAATVPFGPDVEPMRTQTHDDRYNYEVLFGTPPVPEDPGASAGEPEPAESPEPADDAEGNPELDDPEQSGDSGQPDETDNTGPTDGAGQNGGPTDEARSEAEQLELERRLEESAR